MAKYNKVGVPVLSFHNPAGQIFYPKGLYSYAIGNTRGRELAENFGTKKGQHLDLLLLASGDVRNVLYTTSGLSLRKSGDRPYSINFHINDYDPSVVARNAVICELIDTIDSDLPSDVDFLWNVWYNMTLSKPDFERLRQVLTTLAEKKFHESDVLEFQSSGVLQECQNIWMDWKNLDLNVKGVKEERMKLIENSAKKPKPTDLCLDVMMQVLMSPSDMSEIAVPTSSFFKELDHWYREGSTNYEVACVNPTLIRPFVHNWRVHYGACPFEGYLPIEREELLKCGSFTIACKSLLKILVKQFQQMKQVTSIKIIPWTGDGLLLCTSGFPEELSFDIIDTSNVSDHIGLLNVLVCCSPRLKRELESEMFTSSMLWSENSKRTEDYFNECIGIDPYLLPTLLGLNLAEDFDLGSRKLPYKTHMTEETLCWARTGTKRTLLKIDESSDVVQALQMFAERCFGLNTDPQSQIYGGTLPSPLTFLRIIHQLHSLIEGGASRILDLLHGKLPTDFEDKFGLSWNLIKAATGKSEPIVEVTVGVEVSASQTSTPMPMIVILDESNSSKALYQLVKPQSFPVIYNSLRYDDDRHMVTFHLVKRDWDVMKEKSWLQIVSNNLFPLIESETVFLGNEDAIVNVKLVDPIETFGLFSAQKFSICAARMDEYVLEVKQIQECKYSYYAELAIDDPAKCEAATMKINFHPEHCPTAVTVKFRDVIGCTMYFSCPIQESSKFQISKKQRKITCQIPKRHDGVVGERILRNPAQIPFHALTRWTSGLTSASLACRRMFRSELDTLLMIQGSSGSPFYDLRESIQMIIQHTIEHPEIPTLHLIEGHPLIDRPYESGTDIMQKKGLIIKVEEIYNWNHAPTTKILFYDCKEFGEKVSRNPTASDSVRMLNSFFEVAFAHRAKAILASKEEIDLFRKMIYVNAARTAQEGLSGSVWKRSFICTVFPREGNSNAMRRILAQENEGGYPAHPNNLFESAAGRTPSNELKNDRSGSGILSQLKEGEWADLMSNVLESMASRTPNESKNHPSGPDEDVKGVKCGFCLCESGNLKRCMGCKKVYYCSKECQRRHWKLEHRTTCQKTP